MTTKRTNLPRLHVDGFIRMSPAGRVMQRGTAIWARDPSDEGNPYPGKVAVMSESMPDWVTGRLDIAGRASPKRVAEELAHRSNVFDKLVGAIEWLADHFDLNADDGPAGKIARDALDAALGDDR